MRDSEQGDGAFLIAAVMIGLLLLGGAGMSFVWMRQRAQLAQREAIMQMERAEAEAVRAEAVRAEAIARRQQAEALAAEAAMAKNQIESGNESLELEIGELLDAQMEAWNNADVERYMESYELSDELIVNLNNRTIQSWDAVQEQLKESGFPGGELQLSDVRITRLGEDAAMAIGNWTLGGSDQPSTGVVTMVLRRTEGKWAIVHDHRSELTVE